MTFIEKWPNSVRWILLLPGSLAVGFVYRTIVSLFWYWFVGYSNWISPYGQVIFDGFFLPLGILMGAEYISPSHKKAVVQWFCIILGIIVGMCFFLNFINYNYEIFCKENVTCIFFIFVCAIAGIQGSVLNKNGGEQE